MTPVLLQQFRIFYATAPIVTRSSARRESAAAQNDRPLGVVFWATVNDDVEKMLTEGTTKLRPQDWKSGEKLWVVEAIAPFGGAEEMLKDLKAKVFADRELRYVATTVEGKEVRVV